MLHGKNFLFCSCSVGFMKHAIRIVTQRTGYYARQNAQCLHATKSLVLKLYSTLGINVRQAFLHRSFGLYLCGYLSDHDSTFTTGYIIQW